ncbi:MAG: malectin domain-containing carbohydrate-binding protein, partial [Cyanobacteria bacterium P01_H01_bin.150]
APTLQSQLDNLAASAFPANNAVEFQTVDVVLTGEDQDISDLFDFSGVAALDFDGEEQLPLGFVASAIDPNNNNLPIGSVSEPIYLQFYEENNSLDTTLYRVNAGGSEVAALDGDIAWSADTINNNSPFLSNPGSNNTASFPIVGPGANIPENIPDAIFNTERWDQVGDSEMEWAFDVTQSGLYEVRLYMGNGFSGTDDPGERIFDVAIEGSVPANLDDIDLVSQFGHEVGGVITNTVTVTDGTLNLEFIHGVENPLVNGIEIVQLGL